MWLADEKIRSISDSQIFSKPNTKVNICNSVNGCSVTISGTVVCTIDKLTEIINDLTELRANVESETGFKF